MEQGKDEMPTQRSGGYVWDDKKMSWVQAKEALPEEEVTVDTSEGGEEEEISAEEAIVEIPRESPVLEYKGVLVRLGSAIIDLILLIIVSFIVAQTLGRVVNLPDYILPVYGLVYYVGLLSWRGQTLGKMLIGAKVTKTDGSRIGVLRAFLRYIFYLVPLFGPIVYLATDFSVFFVFVLPIIGIVVMALTRQKRGIHDLIAGTVVINTRLPASQPEEVASAEAGEAETSQADTSKQE